MCLTLPSNIGHGETLLDDFSTLRIFFVIKIEKIAHFMDFYDEKYAQS